MHHLFIVSRRFSLISLFSSCNSSLVSHWSSLIACLSLLVSRRLLIVSCHLLVVSCLSSVISCCSSLVSRCSSLLLVTRRSWSKSSLAARINIRFVSFEISPIPASRTLCSTLARLHDCLVARFSAALFPVVISLTFLLVHPLLVYLFKYHEPALRWKLPILTRYNHPSINRALKGNVST